MKLAEQIVRMCHGEREAKQAQDAFENTFSKKEFPNDAQVLTAGKDEKLADVLTGHNIVESKSEFRRLIEAGAVSDFPDQKINDPNEMVGEEERKLKIGKKTFVVLKPNN
jgi:tyrosyl-tRNA synthetase